MGNITFDPKATYVPPESRHQVEQQRLTQIPLHSRYHASPQILPGPPPIGDFLEPLLALRAMGLRMTGGGCRSVSPSALIQRLLSIGRRELNFKRMNLIPLGVSSLGLPYRQKLLQATLGGNRLWCSHGDIIPSLERCSPARPALQTWVRGATLS